ncbi:hypothetical protein I4U23_026372 [Adineta vaga]|nr:hypothetical protein I4U23_026372 [Adineta vaga]
MMNQPNEHTAGFCQNLVGFLQNYNLFPSSPPSKCRSELSVQRVSTMIFIFLSILLLTMPSIYISYTISTDPYYRQSIIQPSYLTYLTLYSKYPESLSCQCNQISISYATFLQIKVTLHQICISVFVTNNWIESLIVNDGTEIFEEDFRKTAPHAFEALSMFCDMSNRSIHNNLQQFLSNEYISTHVTTMRTFDERINFKLTQLFLSMVENFQVSIAMIQRTIHINGLFSGLGINYELHRKNTDNNSIFIKPKKYNDCSCSRSSYCAQKSSIYNYPNPLSSFDVPGFYIGCNVIDALLQSDLRCFYDLNCLDQLQQHLPSLLSIPVHASSLLPFDSRFSAKTPILHLVNELMIEERVTTVSHQYYYDQCEPISCTFITKSSENISMAIHIIGVILPTIGGILPVLKLIISIFTNIIIFCIRKPSNRIAPNTLNIYT